MDRIDNQATNEGTAQEQGTASVPTGTLAKIRTFIDRRLGKASTVQPTETKPASESLQQYFFPVEGHREHYTGYGQQHFSFTGNPVMVLSGDPGNTTTPDQTSKLDVLFSIKSAGISRSQLEQALKQDAVVRYPDGKYRKVREITTDELRVWTTGAGAER